MNGRGVYYAANGSSEERNYVNSVMHGPATLFMANGDTEERTYESGETNSYSELNSGFTRTGGSMPPVVF